MIQDNLRRQQAREAAEICAQVLKEQFGVREVYLFGSLAGQSPWHSRSDIDLAVEGLAPKDYFRALSVLYKLLPEDVELDLITLETAPPELIARVKGEREVPADSKEALAQDITDELISLGRIIDQAKLLLQRIPPEPTFIENSAAGKLAHDFYTGVERIFKRITVRRGLELPTGVRWHTLLLESMESAVKGIRPSVIDHELALRLLEYLRFRHRFRHTYDDELEWDKLLPLLEGLEETLTRLRQQLEQFLRELRQS